MMSLAILSSSLKNVSDYVFACRVIYNIPEVVGDDNDTTGEGVDSIGKGVDGWNIETVGRLVEKKHVWSLDGEDSEDDSGLLTLGKSTHKSGLAFTGKTVLFQAVLSSTAYLD